MSSSPLTATSQVRMGGRSSGQNPSVSARCGNRPLCPRPERRHGTSPGRKNSMRRCRAVSSLGGERPDKHNNSGSTPFHLAVQSTGGGGTGEEIARDAQRRIVEGFLSSGVSTDLKDGRGRSVLECAQSDWIRDILVSNGSHNNVLYGTSSSS